MSGTAYTITVSEYWPRDDFESRYIYTGTRSGNMITGNFVGDAKDQNMMDGLGKFDLVYSAFSLHHWKDPETSISNLWNAVRDDGILYIYDFKRVWWLYLLPLRSGVIDSIRAAYAPNEVRTILEKLGISNYKVRTRFPFFLQSVVAWR